MLTLKKLLFFATYSVDSFDNCENVLFDKTIKWLLLKSLNNNNNNYYYIKN